MQTLVVDVLQGATAVSHVCSGRFLGAGAEGAAGAQQLLVSHGDVLQLHRVAPDGMLEHVRPFHLLQRAELVVPLPGGGDATPDAVLVLTEGDQVVILRERQGQGVPSSRGVLEEVASATLPLPGPAPTGVHVRRLAGACSSRARCVGMPGQPAAVVLTAVSTYQDYIHVISVRPAEQHGGTGAGSSAAAGPAGLRVEAWRIEDVPFLGAEPAASEWEQQMIWTLHQLGVHVVRGYGLVSQCSDSVRHRGSSTCTCVCFFLPVLRCHLWQVDDRQPHHPSHGVPGPDCRRASRQPAGAGGAAPVRR